jgi:alpha-tubulin suppressor-like RCC1 family protein
MNINNLQIQLQEAVNNAAAEATTDGTSSTLYYLQLAKAVQALNMGQIRTVATEASLPAAASNTGLLVFVTGEELLYFSDGTAWATIVPPVVYNNSIWTWGIGGSGARGDNTNTGCTSSPGSVVGGFTDWCQISMGGSGPGGVAHGHAIRTNGTAWGWGYWSAGVLGNNGTYGVGSSSPVSVTGGFTDWCQISAGDTHTLAVRQNGTAWGWGCGGAGKLGNNCTTNRPSPVSVVGGFTDWCQIATSPKSCHSLGVRQNGTAWGWGCGSIGRLGDNTTADKSSPVSVVGGFTDWCQVSAGYQHSIAVRQNGTAWGWGAAGSGRLGTNSTVSSSSPVSVVGGFTDWCQVVAGRGSSLGVRQNGTAWGWGSNYSGVLGDNTECYLVAKSSPVSVVGGFTDWCQISIGSYGVNAVRTNGTAWAWGNNTGGALGDGTTVNKSSPVSVVGGFTDWCQVSAGYGISAGIRSTAT